MRSSLLFPLLCASAVACGEAPPAAHPPVAVTSATAAPTPAKPRELAFGRTFDFRTYAVPPGFARGAAVAFSHAKCTAEENDDGSLVALRCVAGPPILEQKRAATNDAIFPRLFACSAPREVPPSSALLAKLTADIRAQRAPHTDAKTALAVTLDVVRHAKQPIYGATPKKTPQPDCDPTRCKPPACSCLDRFMGPHPPPPSGPIVGYRIEDERSTSPTYLAETDAVVRAENGHLTLSSTFTRAIDGAAVDERFQVPATGTDDAFFAELARKMSLVDPKHESPLDRVAFHANVALLAAHANDLAQLRGARAGLEAARKELAALPWTREIGAALDLAKELAAKLALADGDDFSVVDPCAGN